MTRWGRISAEGRIAEAVNDETAWQWVWGWIKTLFWFAVGLAVLGNILVRGCAMM